MDILKNLQETDAQEDFIDINDQVQYLTNYCESLSTSGILGIIGKAGNGKSVLIREVEKNIANEKNAIVHFEARKYPGKSQLRECLILTIAENLFTKDLRDDFKRQIEGGLPKEAEETKAIIATITTIGNFFSAATSALTGSPMIGVSTENLDNLYQMFAYKGAKRYLDLEKIFQTLINYIIHSKKSKLYIIIEDADRADEGGRYFLETLNSYLTHHRESNEREENLKVIPIVLFNDESLNEESSYHYLKIFDYVRQYKPDIKWDVLIGRIFYADKDNAEKFGIFADFISYFGPKWKLSIREFKYIVRQLYQQFHQIQNNDKLCLYTYLTLHFGRYITFERGGGGKGNFINMTGMPVHGLNQFMKIPEKEGRNRARKTLHENKDQKQYRQLVSKILDLQTTEESPKKRRDGIRFHNEKTIRIQEEMGYPRDRRGNSNQDIPVFFFLIPEEYRATA